MWGCPGREDLSLGCPSYENSLVRLPGHRNHQLPAQKAPESDFRPRGIPGSTPSTKAPQTARRPGKTAKMGSSLGMPASKTARASTIGSPINRASTQGSRARGAGCWGLPCQHPRLPANNTLGSQTRGSGYRSIPGRHRRLPGKLDLHAGLQNRRAGYRNYPGQPKQSLIPGCHPLEQSSPSNSLSPQINSCGATETPLTDELQTAFTNRMLLRGKDDESDTGFDFLRWLHTGHLAS